MRKWLLLLGLNMRGIIEYSNQNPKKAMAYFMKCKKIIQKYKLPKKIYQNWLNNNSIIYEQMGDREMATKYAIEPINYQEKNKLNPLKTSPYYQLADNLKFYKKYDEALAYYNKGLALEKEYKNLTANAVKALKETQNPNITWKAWRENSLTFLSITDNGKGAADEQFRALYDEKEVSGIKTGLGLHLIRDLAKAIDCTITVDSKTNLGTSITLRL